MNSESKTSANSGATSGYSGHWRDGAASMGASPGPFDNPAYKKLSKINGAINRMTKDEMKEKLAQLHLDTRGLKDVLKKRLKSYYKRRTLAQSSGVPMKKIRYDYYMVIDFEATCERNCKNYPHEIIEFPIILVNAADGSKVDEFHSYIKPTKNSHLTEFCQALTGITQDQVDSAPSFPDVLHCVEDWMRNHNLGSRKKFAIVTDGPWDMSRFMHIQCISSGIPFPKWACRWVNIRKIYCNSYNSTEKLGITGMLENLGLMFEGHQHSGLDDARNIARILSQLIIDGCNIYVNEKMSQQKLSASAVAVRSAIDENLPEVLVVRQDEQRSSDDEAECIAEEVDEGPAENDLANDKVKIGKSDEETSGSDTTTKTDVEIGGPSAKRIGSGDLVNCAGLLEHLSLKNS